MDTAGLKQRHATGEPQQAPPEPAIRQHPAGPAKHGGAKQALRMFLFGLYFFGSCIW